MSSAGGGTTTAMEKEPVRVLVRMRPRMESIPSHPQYSSAVKIAAHNPDCLFLMDKTTLKISSEAKCTCKDCTRKTGGLHNPDGKIERFGTARNKKDKFFRFDKILPAATTQSELYDEVADSVLNCIQGFNSTIISYGSTGTGKSHTMIGTTEDPGIIPRVMVDAFHVIDNTRDQDLDVYFHIEISYVEMYNNVFKNLLRSATIELNKIEASGGDIDNPTEEQSEVFSNIVDNYESMYAKYEAEKLSNDKISVHESPALGVFLTGKNLRITVRTAEEALNLYRLGNKVRAVRGSEKEDSSSRSHAILTFHVESKLTVDTFDEEAMEKDAEMLGLNTKTSELKIAAEFEKELDRAIDLAAGGDASSVASMFEIRIGKIHLVHLAGSERLKETGATGGNMKETQNINKSLLALGEVLHSLSINCTATSASGEVHVPYYNSKLTHILKDSLGGNSRSTMICTMGSESSMYHHSLYSLMFAARAFKVINMVHINRLIIDPDLLQAKDDAAILKELKEKLLASASATPLKANQKFAKMNRNNADPSSKTPKKETLSVVRTAKPDMSALTKMVEKEKPAKVERKLSKAPSQEEKVETKTSDKETTEEEPKPEPEPLPPPPPKATAYSLWIDGITAQDLKYITFPLCPAINLRIGDRELHTQRRIYKNSVEYPESFQIEFPIEEFDNGMMMQVSVINVDPFGVKSAIGGGGMELQSVLSPVETRDQENYITMEILDEDELVSGHVTFYACLMERDPEDKSNLTYGEVPKQDHLIFSQPMNSSSLDKIFEKVNDDAVSSLPEKNSKSCFDFGSELVVQRIVCTELPLDHHPVAAVTPDAEFDYMVTLEVKRQTHKTTLGKGKVRFPPNLHIPHNGHAHAGAIGPTAHVTFENPNIAFDVDPEHMDWESINIALFDAEIQNLDDPNYVGKATGQMLSLQGIRGNDDVRDFALQLKDVNHMPAGKVVISFVLNDPTVAMSTASETLVTTSSIEVPMTPCKTPRKRSVEHQRTPRLGNVRIPGRFQNGWVHIHGITGTGLNKFQLIGKHARHEHIREQPLSPIPKHLKQSELKGLQDPFVVCEIGDFWTSYTKVLLDQSWDCVWDKLKFSCYITNEDASTKDLKLTVYDRSYQAHDVYIGSATLPLVNLFAVPMKTEFATEVTVYDRHGKSNGKLSITTLCQGTAETGERWSVGTIRTINGRGRYDVVYDDGEEEFDIHKDFIRLAPTVAHHQHAKTKKAFTQQPRFKRGDAVEVNSQTGRGVWLPAKIKCDNEDGTYDIDSDYVVQKVNVSENHIRPMREKSGTISPSPAGGGNNSRRPSGSLPEVKPKYSLWEKIEGNYKSKGTWYQGKIFKVRQYETYCAYDVSYDSGEVEYDVLEKSIRVIRSKSITKIDNFQLATNSSHTSGQNSPRATSPRPGIQRGDSKAHFRNRSRGAVDINSLEDGFNAADVDVSASGTITGTGIAAMNVGTESKFQVGQQIEVNYRGHGLYQSGRIDVDNENGFYDVIYDGGEIDQDVPEDFIRLPVETDNSGPVRYHYQVGDKVLGNYREIGRWNPGVISRVRENGVYDIHYDEGRDETKISDDNIKLVKANPHKPMKTSKYEVDQHVEVNVDGLGVWLPAHVVKVVNPGVYDVQYEDNHQDYSVDEVLLRRGGAYTPAIHCTKPVFKVGDRVRVVCRAAEVEKEIRGLTALKQRINEERKALSEELERVKENKESLQQKDKSFNSEEKRLTDFLAVVGDAQVSYERKYGPSKSVDPINSISLSSNGSFYGSTRDMKAAMIEQAKVQASDESKEPAIVVGRAVTVECSLGKMSVKARDRICDVASKSHTAEREDEVRADAYATLREPVEVKARKRSDYPEDEVLLFKEAIALGEKELNKIMSARKNAMEENDAILKAQDKTEHATKCYHTALLKGQISFAQLLKEEVEIAERKCAAVALAEADGERPSTVLSSSSKIDAVPTYDSVMTLAAKSTVGMGDIYAASMDFDAVYGTSPPTPPPAPEGMKRQSLHVDGSQAFDFDFQAVDFDGEVEDVDMEDDDSAADLDDSCHNKFDEDGVIIQEPFIDVSEYSTEELYDAIFDTAMGDAANYPVEVHATKLVDDAVVDYHAIYDAARRNGESATEESSAPIGVRESSFAEGDSGSSADETSSGLGPKQHLKMSLRHLIEAQEMLRKSVERIEVATSDYEKSNEKAQKLSAEVTFAQNSVKKNETNLSNDLDRGSTMESYAKYKHDKAEFAQIEAQLQDRIGSKEAEIFKAEGIKHDRQLETAAANTFEEDRIRCDQAARSAMMNRNSHRALRFIRNLQLDIDREVASLNSATGHCKDEITALVTAKFFADEQANAAAEARRRAIQYAIALTMLKNAQRERDLERLRVAQLRAQEADDDLDAAKDISRIKSEELGAQRDEIAAAREILKAMRTKVADSKDVTTPDSREGTPRMSRSPRGSFASTSRNSLDGSSSGKFFSSQRRASNKQVDPYGKEKSALKNKADQAAKSRAVEEEKAAVAAKDREEEEHVAKAALEIEQQEMQRAAEEADQLRILRS